MLTAMSLKNCVLNSLHECDPTFTEVFEAESTTIFLGEENLGT